MATTSRFPENIESSESEDEDNNSLSEEIPTDEDSDYEDNPNYDSQSESSSDSSESSYDDNLPRAHLRQNANQQSLRRTEGETLIAKSGKEWSLGGSVQGRTRAANILTERSGLTRLAVFQSIPQALELFLTPVIKDIIIRETNRHADRIYQEARQKKPQREIARWAHLDESEFDSFVGLLLLAGVYRSCNESLDELWSSKNGRPIFRATMSKNRFVQILRFCRFDNKLTRMERQRTDKLAAFRDIWELFIAQLQVMYRPGADMTIDEQLVPCRGRCSFRQYIPSKPGKYGLKIFWICDSAVSYPLRGEVYLGKQPEATRTQNVSRDVVKKLCEPWRSTGRNITMDNFFTDVSLASDLLEDRLTIVGTIRKNKGDIPQELKTAQGRELYSSKFCFSDSLTLVSYVPKPKKAVILLSSMHHDSIVGDPPKRKPHIIEYYNATKGGVDSFDQRVRTYSCKRKGNRWPMVLFFNLVDTAGLAAFVVWTTQNPEWNEGKRHRRRLFLVELGMALVQAQIERRRDNPRAMQKGVRSAFQALGIPLSLSSLQSEEGEPTRKQRCHICPREVDRKVKQKCYVCSLPTCSEHSAVHCKNCSYGLDC